MDLGYVLSSIILEKDRRYIRKMKTYYLRLSFCFLEFYEFIWFWD